IGKHVLKRMALSRLDSEGPLALSVLRRKLGAPASGSRGAQGFKQLCEQTLPDDYLARHELGFCFADKAELVLFELFSTLLLAGGPGGPEDVQMTEFLRERAAGPVALPL